VILHIYRYLTKLLTKLYIVIKNMFFNDNALLCYLVIIISVMEMIRHIQKNVKSAVVTNGQLSKYSYNQSSAHLKVVNVFGAMCRASRHFDDCRGALAPFTRVVNYVTVLSACQVRKMRERIRTITKRDLSLCTIIELCNK